MAPGKMHFLVALNLFAPNGLSKGPQIVYIFSCVLPPSLIRVVKIELFPL